MFLVDVLVILVFAGLLIITTLSRSGEERQHRGQQVAIFAGWVTWCCSLCTTTSSWPRGDICLFVVYDTVMRLTFKETHAACLIIIILKSYLLVMLSVVLRGYLNGIQGFLNENAPTGAFSVVFYNMLLIKNLKPEEQDFICYKKMCQSWGLGEKVVCQTLRGPHWPKYKIVNSNPTLTNQKRTLGTQTFNSAKMASDKIPQLRISKGNFNVS